MFTTRPEIEGTFGVVAATHWIASGVGMSMLERGGNAFDACIAAGFTMQVVEPHLCGPGGEVPAIFHSVRTGKIEVLCGQGVGPAAATIERYKAEGLESVPGSGLLAAVNPGQFDAWMMLLADYGSLTLRDVLEPAIHYARSGHPLLPRVISTVAELADFFRAEWPSSAETWLPGGQPPEANRLFKREALADCYDRILKEAEAVGGSRDVQIRAARKIFSQGFVAEEIDRFCRTQEPMDSSGMRHRGVLTAQDMAGWHATYEKPVTYDYHGWRLCKTGPWGQGPVFAQILSLLKGIDIGGMDAVGPDFVHTVTEAMKLAFADREAYYGDPDFCDVPLETLLCDPYSDARRALIGPRASFELRPGRLSGFEAQVDAMPSLGLDNIKAFDAAGIGEPSMSHLANPKVQAAAGRAAGSVLRGDTVHVDVIDRWGNMISATPSGGWLMSSPTIPSLGFCLNTRGQMFWLTPGLPASLAPGKRPRTTLTPSLALQDGEPRLVFGTPGGDQQDQWQSILFLRHVHHGLSLQEAIELPAFHTRHFPSSFFPRVSSPGHLLVEANFGDKTIRELESRGHKLEIAPDWSVGRLTAASRHSDGMLRAAATPRFMTAYAVGR